MGLRVDVCRDRSAWDAYVKDRPHASNYHRWVWKQVIEETYGHKGYYLAAMRDGSIQGILPLIRTRSRLFGDFMTSIPFFSHGGVLADTGDARRSLLTEAEELGRELGVRHIELRQGSECDVNWPAETNKVSMGMPLPASVEDLFQSFPGKLRNRIRRSEKQGFELRLGGLDAVETFYRIFAVDMRHLGTPVYPRAWFENICRYERDRTRILMACVGGKPVAVALVIGFRDTLEVPWSASLPASRKHYSAVWLEWKMFCWAVENGYRWMDLGRSTPGSNSYRFKRQWAKYEKPLHWYYWRAPGASRRSIRKEDARFGLAIRIWRRLPLRLTEWLGPRIAGGIP